MSIRLASGLAAFVFVHVCILECPIASVDAPADQFPRGAETALERFLISEEPGLRSYRARRYLRAENPRFHARGDLEAITELTEDGTFHYQIRSESGSRHVRDRVLRPVLRDEAALWRMGELRRNALTEENYTFEPGPDAPAVDEVRVLIKPRRRDVLLVDGALFLSAGDGDLRRVEGRLSKNPSFWTYRVDVVRRYARVGGVRVPVATEAVAHLRVAGRSEFSMAYEYESINGRPVETANDPAIRAAVTLRAP